MTPYIGEIRQFAAPVAPQGWLFCEGQILDSFKYEMLFTLLSNTYGGDGMTTFALPDLRGRVPVHQGNGVRVGQMGGSETVRMVYDELPKHTHIPQASSTGGIDAPAGNTWGASSALPYVAKAANKNMNALAMDAAGGNQPHENMQPFMVLSYAIAFDGVFPSRP